MSWNVDRNDVWSVTPIPRPPWLNLNVHCCHWFSDISSTSIIDVTMFRKILLNGCSRWGIVKDGGTVRSRWFVFVLKHCLRSRNLIWLSSSSIGFWLCSLIAFIFSVRYLIWNSFVPIGLPSKLMPYSSTEPSLSGCSLTLEVNSCYSPSESVSFVNRLTASTLLLHLPRSILVLSLRKWIP